MGVQIKGIQIKNLWQQWYGALAFGTSVSLAVFALRMTGMLQLLEWASLDYGFRLRTPESIDPHIVIVTIDDTDLEQLGEYPISDETLAQVIDTLNQARPRIIGLTLYRDLPVAPGSGQLNQLMEATPHLIGIHKMIGDRLIPRQFWPNGVRWDLTIWSPMEMAKCDGPSCPIRIIKTIYS
jgi:CHASE2 domain-containing sensor protein